MSFIYKITNDINNKVYVGKTNLSIEQRFQEHIRDSRKMSEQKRPLYNAINKYGIEHFSISMIEKCLPSEASEKQRYWIGYYKGYEDGYNATQGGDGKLLYNHQLIAQQLQQHPYAKDVAQKFGCSVYSIYIIAKEFNIKLLSKGIDNVNKKRQVNQYTKTGIFLRTFESTQKAAEWCLQQGIIKQVTSGVRSHISEAARGKRKSAYTYCWKYE